MATPTNGWAEGGLMLARARSNANNKFYLYDDDYTVIPVDDTTGNPTGFIHTQDAGATLQVGPFDEVGGVLQVPPDGDDNDEHVAAVKGQAFIFNTTQRVYFETRVKLAENGGTAGKSSCLVGLSDTVGANSTVDGGTLMVSFDGALFHKNEDGTGWSFTTSNATAQTSSLNLANATFTEDEYVKLGFLYLPNDGVTAKIIPLVNNVQATDSNGVLLLHSLTISGLLEMQVVYGAKMAATTGECALRIDKTSCVQDAASRL